MELPTLPPTDSESARLAADLASLNVGQVRTDRHDRMLYATDGSIYQVEPLAVVLPETFDQVTALLKYCNKKWVPLLARGGGTSLAGQCTSRAVVLDLSAFSRRVLSVDIPARRCEVEPGITIESLNLHLSSMNSGLFFAPDPATVAQAAIGGCIGNNAAGARSIRYGRTSENIAGIDVILATGERTWLGPGAGRKCAIARRLADGVAGIVQRHAGIILARFPRLVRRNAGYGLDLILQQLDRGIAVDDLDLTGLICGSEGTLAVTAGATLKLHPVPIARGLALVSFATLEDAIDAIGPIVATHPTAVELLDDVVLDAAAGNTECRRYLELMPKIQLKLPKAVLYVEYSAERDHGEIDAAFDRLRAILRPDRVAFLRDGRMAQAWALRKAGEPLLHGISATRKPQTFVEDNSVPIENLSRFVAGFKRIVAHHGTFAAYYAHASVGVLHIRPLIDLHVPADRERMRLIAVEVADLARDCGGVMSGEHGDGRIRGPLLERFFGPELLAAFREVKEIFDPRGILNPGNIVGAGPVESITDHLRVKPADREIVVPAVETYFDYEDQHGFAGAVEMCNGAGFCRKTSGGTMCPSYRATLDERHSTRGRGNALRLAITGQLNSGGSSEPAWNDPATIETLDLCLSCKACKSECPSNVDISRLKAEYTAQRYRTHTVPLAAKMFGHIRTVNRIGSMFPRVANCFNRLPLVRALLNQLLGISPRRSLPPFAPSLYQWFNRREPSRRPSKVVLFADCFATYNEPEIGRSAVAVLESLGYEVLLPRVGCCGRAMLSNGLLEQAAGTIDAAVRQLGDAIVDSSVQAIVFLEPSCLSAVADEWQNLKLKSPPDLRQRLAAKSFLAEDFVERFWNEHPAQPDLSSLAGETPNVILHGHCHQKALWGDGSTAAALRRFVGDRVTVLPSGCCGMAGAFGFTADHYDLSMKIGELSLFGPVRAAAGDTIISAPGTSCRHQIRDGTGRAAKHPIEIIAERISEKAGSSGNSMGPRSRP
jgi:FAD/FMN-containing dehydrogenase/Fe-S oxidoreductase